MMQTQRSDDGRFRSAPSTPTARLSGDSQPEPSPVCGKMEIKNGVIYSSEAAISRSMEKLSIINENNGNSIGKNETINPLSRHVNGNDDHPDPDEGRSDTDRDQYGRDETVDGNIDINHEIDGNEDSAALRRVTNEAESRSSGSSDPDKPVRLFVGQVPETMVEPHLTDLFQGIGVKVLDVAIIRDRHTTRHRHCAFITVPSRAQADTAVSEFHNKKYLESMSNPMQVKDANQPKTRAAYMSTGPGYASIGTFGPNTFFSAPGKGLYKIPNAATQAFSPFAMPGLVSQAAYISPMAQTVPQFTSMTTGFQGYANAQPGFSQPQYMYGYFPQGAASADYTDFSVQARASASMVQSQDMSHAMYNSFSVSSFPNNASGVNTNNYGYSVPENDMNRAWQNSFAMDKRRGTDVSHFGSVPTSSNSQVLNSSQEDALMKESYPQYAYVSGNEHLDAERASGKMNNVAPRVSQMNYQSVPNQVMPSTPNMMQQSMAYNFQSQSPAGYPQYAFQSPRSHSQHLGDKSITYIEGPPGANLFVNNLPDHVDDACLLHIFAHYGNILSYKVFVDKFTQRSKGFGFVSFGTVHEAREAIKERNGWEIEPTRKLVVELKRSKRRIQDLLI